MPRFSDLETYFVCPYRHGCPYLEGLGTKWVWERFQEAAGLECRYEQVIAQLDQELAQTQTELKKTQQERDQFRAQLQALHRRQFKGRRAAPTPPAESPSGQRKKRGAPFGHPPWQRAQPKQIDRVVKVPAPDCCPHCQCAGLQAVAKIHPHLQEDIVLEPRTVTTCYAHQLAYCPECDREVWQAGPGELPGSYIGPAAKATEVYLRQELNVPYRKISRFFGEFFGLKFVPASAYGFERQTVRRGWPLYQDLGQKIRALSFLHADETSWRHDGQNYWNWYAGNDDLAFFHLDAHRSAEAAQSVLGHRFPGTIVADAYASYKGVHPKDWQSCLLRR